MPRRIRPGKLRRRLAIAFVLVAGISAGALALGSYLLVRQSRLDESLDRAAEIARSRLTLAGQQFVPLNETNIQGLLLGFRQSGEPVVLVVGDATLPSISTVEPPIPPGLRAAVQAGDIAFQRVIHQGEHLLLVGGKIPGSEAELYFVTNEERIQSDLDQLRTVLLIGWGAVVVLAGVVGQLLARRTLEPVARASEAARSMAEGLLATRLPVEGQDEFGAWAASFNEMAEALQGKIIALSEAQARERRFTSDVAHELRTPLTALVAEASLLAEHLDRLPPESRRPAELLIQDVGRLRRLVEELIEISRFDQGAESVQAEEVDVAALVAATVRNRGWDGRVAVEGNGRSLTTDPRRLERIVANLVDNAFEHGGSAVTVRITGDGIEVADDGPGIAPEHLPHLFERFYKADASRSGSGTGLGLAIAQENARLLGGEIQVQSELGAGSRFTLQLPVAEPLRPRDGSVS